MGDRRVRCAVVSAVIAAAALSPAGSDAASRSCGTHHGNWRTTTAPADLTTPGHVGADLGATYLAVDPLDPNHIYATPDTRRIVRSLDGGCTWTTVFDLATLPNQPTDSFYTAT